MITDIQEIPLMWSDTWHVCVHIPYITHLALAMTPCGDAS